MITTTFKQLRDLGACSSRYRYLAKALGGIKQYGNKTPITIKQVCDICGNDDADWLFLRLYNPFMSKRKIKLSGERLG